MQYKKNLPYYPLLVILLLIILGLVGLAYYFVWDYRNRQIELIAHQNIDALQGEYQATINAYGLQFKSLVSTTFNNNPLIESWFQEEPNIFDESHYREGLSPIMGLLKNNGLTNIAFASTKDKARVLWLSDSPYDSPYSVWSGVPSNPKDLSYTINGYTGNFYFYLNLDNYGPDSLAIPIISSIAMTEALEYFYGGRYSVYLKQGARLIDGSKLELAHMPPHSNIPVTVYKQIIKEYFDNYDNMNSTELPEWTTMSWGDHYFSITAIPLINGMDSSVGYLIETKEAHEYSSLINTYYDRLRYLSYSLLVLICLFLLISYLIRKLIHSSRQVNFLLNKQKMFLTSVSHELRAPLQGIKGLAELIMDEKSLTQNQAYGTLIKNSTEQLLLIVNDILDIAKFDKQGVSVVKSKIILYDFFEDFATFVKPQFDKKELFCEWIIDKEVPREIQCDPLRLHQIITNLVVNALKFTSQGGVTLSLLLTERQNNTYLLLQVMDSGCGIKKEDIKRIFIDFEQVADHPTWDINSRGTGLGLSIVNTIVKAMGGKIEVSSQWGKGSTFSILIPFDSVKDDHPEKEKQKEEVPSFDGKCVFYADDDEINRAYMQEYLSRLGIQVFTAHSGYELVRLRQQQKVDLIISDIHMPQLSGQEASRRIRQWEFMAEAERIPIIAVTGDISYIDHPKLSDMVIDEFLLKPFNSEDIILILNKYLLDKDDSFPSKDSEPTKNWDSIQEELSYCKYLSLEYLKKQFSSSDTFSIYLDLIKIFLNETSPRIAKFLSNGKKYASNEIVEEAHHLKGSCHLIGLTKLAEEWQKWEHNPEIILDNKVIKKCRRMYKSSLKEIKDLYHLLKKM
ncbi:hybrid sensor histidine kinase/response regulator [Spirochaeta cellobiosiphila]|uniref:hybrid sensor histidine kinase/response regulator n=1 Tax=Spirochaeta cellobiosiphila TaxID=504483 RepID=UPI0003FC8E9D|nr:ATP-binding protein [Spirochaeta cellobiosiphila]